MKPKTEPGFSDRPLLEELSIRVASFKKGFALMCEEHRIVGNGRILGFGYLD